MIFEKIKEIIVDQIGASPEDLHMETDLLTDLEADSLDSVEVLMAIEEEFDIEIPDEDAIKFLKIRDIVEYLEKAI